MDKEKILEYLKRRREELQKQYNENVNLDNRYISKEKLIVSTSKALEEIKNLQALIQSGLMDNNDGFINYDKYKNGEYVGHGSCLENKWDMIYQHELNNGYSIRRI